jgi:hypothetical protein
MNAKLQEVSVPLFAVRNQVLRFSAVPIIQSPILISSIQHRRYITPLTDCVAK